MAKRVKSLVMVVIMMFSMVFVPEMQVAAKKPEMNFKVQMEAFMLRVGDTRRINVKSIKCLEKKQDWKLAKVTTSNKKKVTILRKNKKTGTAIIKGKRTGKAKITVYLKNKKKQTKKVVYLVTVKSRLKSIKIRSKSKRKISKSAATLQIGDMRQINVKPASLLKKGWKLTKATTSNKKNVAILSKNKKAGTVRIKAKRIGKAKITLYLKSNKRKAKKMVCNITVKPKGTTISSGNNLKRFDTSDWKFDNLVFIYDKLEHLPKLLNVPKEVTPIYSLKPQIKADSYKLNVKFEVPEGYETPSDMETEFVIKKAYPNVSSINFKDTEITLNSNGGYGIYATDLPDEVEVDHYEVNGKEMGLNYSIILPGTYHVKAFFKVKDLQNYNELTTPKEATLTVKKASFDTSNWKFDNLEFTYDKLEHLPKLLNVPKEVVPLYSLEPQIKAGNYKLTVNFAVPEGYEAIPDMETNFIIKKADPDVSGITFEYEGEEVTTKDADGSPIVSMLFNADSEDFYSLIKCKETSIPEELLFNHYIVDGQEQGEDYLITTPGKHVIEAVFKPKDLENYKEVETIKTILDLRYAFELSLDAKEDGEGHLAINIGVANIDKQGLGLTDMIFTLSGIEGLSYQDMESIMIGNQMKISFITQILVCY